MNKLLGTQHSELISQFHKLAYSEKKRYLKFIYDLGRNGLVNLFKFPGENFSLWWFSLVAEKAPLKSDSYEKLISELLRPQNEPSVKKMALIKKTLLFQFLNGLYAICHYMLMTIYAKKVIKDFKERHKRLVNCDYTIVSYFPLLNKEKAEYGIFENKYLAPFHKLLEENHKGRYSHICLSFNIDGMGFKDAVNLVNKFSKNQNVFLLEEFIKFRHLFFILFYYFYFSLLFMFNLKLIKKNTLYEYEGNIYDVWHIFKNDFYRSFCGSNLASSLLYIFAFQKVTASLKKNSKVICVCEMQWWEKALYIFAKKHDLVTIGYQHTIVPELLLNYFNHPNEIEKGQSGHIEKCPLPDYLATVGNIPAELFKKYGWPDERVFVWGAQRFELLKAPNKLFVPWEGKGNYFVCAFSISDSESQRVLLLLEKAFKKTGNYNIYLRSHPSMNIPKLVEELGIKLNPNIFEFTDIPLEEIMQRARGIIVTESSSSLYSLAHGSPVLVPRFIDKIDCNPLSYISAIPIYCCSDDDLINACNHIAKLETSPIADNEAERFLNDYLYFPASNNEYLDKIDSLTHLKNLTL